MDDAYANREREKIARERMHLALERQGIQGNDSAMRAALQAEKRSEQRRKTLRNLEAAAAAGPSSKQLEVEDPPATFNYEIKAGLSLAVTQEEIEFRMTPEEAADFPILNIGQIGDVTLKVPCDVAAISWTLRVKFAVFEQETPFYGGNVWRVVFRKVNAAFDRFFESIRR